MSPQSGLTDPKVVQKQKLLRVFYLATVCGAIAFTGAQYLRSLERYGLLFLSLTAAVVAIWSLVRFLKVIDEFEALYIYGALRVAFVATVSLLATEAFLESFGFPRLPAYDNASFAVIFWTVGLATESWQRHWRKGYEE
jgi:hypothetical protein